MRFGRLAMRCIEDTLLLGRADTREARLADLVRAQLPALEHRLLVRGDRYDVRALPEGEGFCLVPCRDQRKRQDTLSGPCLIRFLPDPWQPTWHAQRQARQFAVNLNAWCDRLDCLTLDPTCLAAALARDHGLLRLLSRYVADPTAPLIDVWCPGDEFTAHVGLASSETPLATPGPSPLLVVRGEPATVATQLLLEHVTRAALHVLGNNIDLQALTPHLGRLQAAGRREPRQARLAIRHAQAILDGLRTS